MSKKVVPGDAEPRTGYEYNPPVDPSEGGVVKVKTRGGKMVEVPPGTKSLADIVAGGEAAPTTGSATPTASRTAASPKIDKPAGDSGQS